ncbi:hypothetical protein [Pseudomonas fluorescens]|uniref:hypothetical protein n=1 Tax=Pseudomonas fluorescens TaxID=294 RepID=UPI001CA3A55A|nr:hypothetical protein [Pseudomonas fluorescens]
MTNNQTIDCVPRALLEVFANSSGKTLAQINGAIQELRALLDAPAENVIDVADESWSEILRAASESSWMPLEYMRNDWADDVCRFLREGPATQPQGEPVERQPDAIIEGVMTSVGISHAIYASTVSLKHGEQVKLYAEQPVQFQSRVQPWMTACFGEAIAADRQERNHRFLEEALELVQANQCTASEAHQLVDYVYGRPVGEPSQEVGGVMVTLAALCLALGLDMHVAAETELARIWTKVEQIRAKQATKPAMSPLPGAYPDREQTAPVAVVLPDQKAVSALVTKAARQADLINGANYYTAAELAAEALIGEVTRLNAKSR